jgi:hypothetical protein
MTKSRIMNADLISKLEMRFHQSVFVDCGLGGSLFLRVSSFGIRHGFGRASHAFKATGLNKAKFRVELSALCEVGKPLFRSV